MEKFQTFGNPHTHHPITSNIMGKRAIDDVVAGEPAIVAKKSKKEKKDKKRKAAPVEETASVTPVGDEVEVDDEKAAKAARKAAKKAKKEAREGKKTKEVLGEASEKLQKDSDAEKAARKAARKAEKKKLKEQAKADPDAMDIDIDTATPSAAPSGLSTGAPSKAESSATSVEPDLEDGSAPYTEHPELAALPQSEIDAFMKEKFVTIDDPKPAGKKLRPILKFSYLPPTNKGLLAPFATFTAPTPIQAACWPALFSGRDMIGVAETGSGKTIAFGVPCVRYISSLPKREQRGVKAVIVSPTRELASQIHEQLVKLAATAGLNVVCIYGGVPKDPQVRDVKKAHIVVATPGRLNDLVGDGSADISNASFVVLDEADRMLDKGFEEPIRQIISQTKKQRQTLMFTATWPPSVRDLASTFMTSPVKISIGDNPTGELRANTRIKQLVEVVEPRDKEYRLLQLLKQYQSGAQRDDRILVFCLYKKEATRIEEFIRRKGFRVAGIHGDLSQEKRTASLAAFKEGKVPILVATDVAARGLDIPAVKVVINVTFPLTAEDYVHRIGRTGRAGKDGLSVTLFTEHDKALSGA